MKTQLDIEKIAACKQNDAEFLYTDGRYDGAYYLGGYTIELLLKAKVCKTLGIDNFFEESWLKKLKYPQTFRNHDLEVLLILSGLYPHFNKDSNTTPSLKQSWSAICGWHEDARYLTGKTKTEADFLLTSIKEIATWIRKHL